MTSNIHDTIQHRKFLYLTALVVINILSSSVTKQQQEQDEQDHMYDFIKVKPLSAEIYDNPINKVASRNSNSMIAANPAYSDGSLLTSGNTEVTQDEDYENIDLQVTQSNPTTIADEDEEYENMDPQPRQINTDDITMDTNPAYAETNFM